MAPLTATFSGSPDIDEIIGSNAFKREQTAFNAECEKVDALSAPIISELADRWRLLEFTPAAMQAMKGDPDIAFQCEWNGYVLRMDFSGEIGPSDFYWKKGSELEALRLWGDEHFAHGSPGRPITCDERESYGWALTETIRFFARYILLPRATD